eukprot:2438996-Pleurochrysis_carterae.AAC.6
MRSVIGVSEASDMRYRVTYRTRYSFVVLYVICTATAPPFFVRHAELVARGTVGLAHVVRAQDDSTSHRFTAHHRAYFLRSHTLAKQARRRTIESTQIASAFPFCIQQRNCHSPH